MFKQADQYGYIMLTMAYYSACWTYRKILTNLNQILKAIVNLWEVHYHYGLNLRNTTPTTSIPSSKCSMKKINLWIHYVNDDVMLQCLMNLWAAHHDEKYWPEPYKFNPERFLTSDGKLVSPDHPNQRRYNENHAWPSMKVFLWWSSQKLLHHSTLTLTLPGPSAGVTGSLDSYCSLKPLCSGMGEVVPARTSPTLLPHSRALCCHYPVSKCRSASIVVTSTVRVKGPVPREWIVGAFDYKMPAFVGKRSKISNNPSQDSPAFFIGHLVTKIKKKKKKKSAKLMNYVSM